jgi:hypothetical protein
MLASATKEIKKEEKKKMLRTHDMIYTHLFLCHYFDYKIDYCLGPIGDGFGVWRSIDSLQLW